MRPSGANLRSQGDNPETLGETTTPKTMPSKQSQMHTNMSEGGEEQTELAKLPDSPQIQVTPPTEKTDNKVNSSAPARATLSSMHWTFMAEKEKVVLALAGVQHHAAQIEGLVQATGMRQGHVEASTITIAEMTHRSRARHTSIQEKRILEREIEQIRNRARDERRGLAGLEKNLSDHHKKYAEAKAALSTALTAFLAYGHTLIDAQQAAHKAESMLKPSGWKDHELILLTQRVKELEAMVSSAEAPVHVSGQPFPG